MKYKIDFNHNKKIGNLGEDFASEYLENLGYKIIDRNYKVKFGEIDIVAVSHETINNNNIYEKVRIIEVKTTVSHENSTIRPIDNAHLYKMRKVAKLGEFYVKQKFSHETPFSIDLVLVKLNSNLCLLNVEYLKDLEIY